MTQPKPKSKKLPVKRTSYVVSINLIFENKTKFAMKEIMEDVIYKLKNASCASDVSCSVSIEGESPKIVLEIHNSEELF